MANLQLPAEVAAEFQLINWTGGHKQFFGKYGIVDLKTLTLQRAKVLAAKGFTKFEKKPAKVATTVTTNKPEKSGK